MILAAKKPIFGKRNKQWKNKTEFRCTNSINVCNANWALRVVYSKITANFASSLRTHSSHDIQPGKF